MTWLLTSLAWFTLTAVCHIFLHKFRLILGLSWGAILGIFILGFIGCLVTIMQLPTPFPLTGMLLYTALTLAFAALTASPSLGDESPMTKVLSLLLQGPQTEKQLVSVLTDDEIFGKRIRDLIRSAWIKREGNFIRLTARGRQIAHIFMLYRKLLGLSEGG